MAIGLNMGLGDAPDEDDAFVVEGFDHVHEGVAVVTHATIEGVEVRGGDGVEFREVVGGGGGVHGAHDFDDLIAVGGSAAASRGYRGGEGGEQGGAQDDGE